MRARKTFNGWGGSNRAWLYESVHWEEAHAPRRYDSRPLDKLQSPRRLRDPVWVAMAEKLKRPEGRALDRRRLCPVEPVFGVIQAVLGFGPFLLRGLQKVRGEGALVCLAYNGKRLHRLGRGWAWPGRAEKPGGGLNSVAFGCQALRQGSRYCRFDQALRFPKLVNPNCLNP